MNWQTLLSRLEDGDRPLEQAAESPERVALRAVCADALLTRGDPRGAFLQADCALLETPRHDSRFADLTGALDEAAAQLDPDWITTVGECDRHRYNLVVTERHGLGVLWAHGAEEVFSSRRGARHGHHSMVPYMRTHELPVAIERGLRRADAEALVERLVELSPESREWLQWVEPNPDDTGVTRPLRLALRYNRNATSMASLRWLVPQPWRWVIDQPEFNHSWRERASERQRRPFGDVDGLDDDTEFDVLLTAVGSERFQVIKAVRARFDVDLRAARALISDLPCVLGTALSRAEARALIHDFAAIGATAEIPRADQPAESEFSELGPGAVTLEAGTPCAVVVQIDDTALRVLDYRLAWVGPHATRLTHELHTALPRAEWPAEARAWPERLRASIAEVCAARRARFITCRFCDSATGPESQYSDDVCHGCASVHLGVVY